MSQVMSCLFTIHIDELLKIRGNPYINGVKLFWILMFILFYRHKNVDVPKVLKISPHFQRWWDKCPLIYESLAEHCLTYYANKWKRK